MNKKAEIFQTLLSQNGEALIRCFWLAGKSKIPHKHETCTSAKGFDGPVAEVVFRLANGEAVCFGEGLWLQVIDQGLEFQLIKLALKGELSLDVALDLLDTAKAARAA